MVNKSVIETYTKDAVETAGPNYTIVMLYDRILLDIEAAGAAFDQRDYQKVHLNLSHAQEIIRLLRSALNFEVWPQAPDMAALYNFFENELFVANTRQDRARMDAVVPLVRRFRDTWKIAAEKCARDGTNDRVSGSGGFLA